MTDSGKEIDELIREALDDADTDALGDLGTPSTMELLAGVFRGRHRRLALGGVLLNLAFFVAAVFSGLQFLGADNERSLLLWGVFLLLFSGAVIAVKIWYWLEMHRLAVTREVKRVELQVVKLARELGERRPG